jgi:glutamyl-tRNA synthetase
MNFVRTFLSKRKLTRVVNDGKVWGWDDPRMPTIRGIMRRGMQVPPFREFILKQGPSRNMLNLEWGAFWAINKKFIDPIAARYTAVDEKDAVHCHVTGIAGPETVTKPKHVKNADLGTKNVMYSNEIILDQADAQSFATDEEITLMNWGNAFVRKITKKGDLVTGIEIELHLEGDVKKTKKKVTWLAAAPSNMTPVDLYAFDYLISKDKLDNDDDLEKCLTPVTEFLTQAVADCNVTELKQGDIMQFDRKGYYRLDKPYTGKKGDRLIFFDIPTGKI